MRLCPGMLSMLGLFAICQTVALAGGPDANQLAGEIDRLIDSRLQREGIPPAEPASDAEFLRRAYLDLHGVVPTREQAEQFLADTKPDKRARLIDALLADARYGDNLADIWTGYLLSPLADDPKLLSDRMRPWLANQFNTRSWDRIASDLLTASGKIEENPAVNYLVEGRLPRGVADLTDLAGRYFLGLRLNCAQCHDHPFVKLKQEEFWGMAAFFAQVQTPRRAKQIYELGIVDDRKLTLASLKDAGTIDGFMPRPPTFLGGEAMAASASSNRAALAQWMTSPNNAYFARAMVNRTWWRLFGRGIVQPVDDMHEGNKPSHPELLDLLARQFIESGYDLKFLTRAIMLSRAYQRTSRTSGLETAAANQQAALFGRMSVKVMSAGQLYDSLQTIFGSPTKTAGIDTRRGARWEFVQFFGESGEPDPTTYRRGIPHLLRQMNSGQFAGRNLEQLVDRLSTSGRSPGDIAGDLFLTILSRRPTAKEQEQFRTYLKNAGSQSEACRELAWVLVMTSEFSLNH